METMGGPWSWAGPTARNEALMAVSKAGRREAASTGAHQLGPGIISQMGHPGRAQVPRDAVEAGVGGEAWPGGGSVISADKRRAQGKAELASG